MNTKQHALAAEIRAEMARRQPPIKASAIQKAIGIGSSAWGTYFVQCTRDIPMHVVFGVADYLGVPASELIARAEAVSVAQDPLTAELEAGLSPRARRAVAEAREEHMRGVERPADPQVTASERTARSA